MKLIIICLSIIGCTLAFPQRSHYAGLRKSVEPESSTLAPGTDNRNQAAIQPSQPEDNRPLPMEVSGDRAYYNQLLALPPNQQPFWLLNHQHILAHQNNPAFQMSPYSRRSHFAGGTA